MEVEEYMCETFPNLKLMPGLFYDWETGIRFELGVNYDWTCAYNNSPYLQGVYKRAITLFKAVHALQDEMYIVVDVNDYGDGKTFKHKINTFAPYVKEKSILYGLKHKIIPYIFPEDDEEGKYKTNRFVLKCTPSDFNYAAMLKAICNHDMGIKPRIFHRVYFINMNRGSVFHVYDDRGCDLIASLPELIRDIYHEYNDWILDYDRAEIDKVFNK
jgi:Domain of unknown function (DUF3885)